MNAAVAPASGLIDAVAPPEQRGIARDEVRLLWTQRESGTHTHASFRDLPAILQDGDVLVVNDSATLPAAIAARRAGGETVPLHISTMIDQRIWITEPRGPVFSGEELQLPGEASAVLIAPVEPEYPRLWYTWLQLPLPMPGYLMKFGQPIRYGYMRERFPLRDYQTVFAREAGSSEMPSAARPFSARVVAQLQERGITVTTITLHCGVSSFESGERPAIERYSVPLRTAETVNRARQEGRRVIAVGTTALRALESSVADGALVASAGWTDLIIDEARGIRTADGLLTGFHEAGATHQWILRAFLAPDVLADAYAQAAQNGYYHHEFGDVHLIL